MHGSPRAAARATVLASVLTVAAASAMGCRLRPGVPPAIAAPGAAACPGEPLLQRAITARGGPMAGFVREVEAVVHAGLPGTWRWDTAFLVPDFYRWTIFTTGEDDHYIWDGAAMRCFVGRIPVTADTSAATAIRSHARWTGVINLDALCAATDGVTLAASPDGRDDGETLYVSFAADGARYVLHFDRAVLLARAEGPIDLPPLGHGLLSVNYGDFRRVRGLLLAHRAAYTFNGAPLFDERTLRIYPNEPALTPGSFEGPPSTDGPLAAVGRGAGVDLVAWGRNRRSRRAVGRWSGETEIPRSAGLPGAGRGVRMVRCDGGGDRIRTDAWRFCRPLP
jgi:hypothetical protein